MFCFFVFWSLILLRMCLPSELWDWDISGKTVGLRALSVSRGLVESPPSIWDWGLVDTPPLSALRLEEGARPLPPLPRSSIWDWGVVVIPPLEL